MMPSRDKEQGLESLAVLKYNMQIMTEALEKLEAGDKQGFDETVDSLYLESVAGKADVINSYVYLLVFHLLKLMYGNDPASHRHLGNEIDNFRTKINRLIRRTGKSKTNVLNYVREDLGSTYKEATEDFVDLVRNNPRDYRSSINLPEKCPWDLEELIEDDTEDLLAKLY